MMNYNYMMGGGSLAFFSWTTYILVTILLVLGIVALVKYVGKK